MLLPSNVIVIPNVIVMVWCFIIGLVSLTGVGGLVAACVASLAF